MRLLNIIALCSALGSTATNLTPVDEIAHALCTTVPDVGTARFTVTMPQLPDDVVYRLSFITEEPAAADSIAPCNYLIDWRGDEHNRGDGFTAYFRGNHYRYSGGNKIQEFHMELDTIPFMPSASARHINKGVQRTARFVDILPPFIAEALEKAAADPSNNSITIHRDTLVGGKASTVVDIVTTVRGVVAKESEYIFDAGTLTPRRITYENNPGSISEQTVSIDYDFTPSAGNGEPLSEQFLLARYPDEFATYRQSNFRIENLRGKPLPGFTLPTTTGERYWRQTGDALRTPTLLVLMESGQTFNRRTVDALREAVDMLPYPADIIWAFADTHTDTIEETVGYHIREGEHLLMSGRGLIRDCGAAMLPAILLVDSKGTVQDVIIGFNNDLAADVIQKMTLLN